MDYLRLILKCKIAKIFLIIVYYVSRINIQEEILDFLISTLNIKFIIKFKTMLDFKIIYFIFLFL
jgi:hypothetical protein